MLKIFSKILIPGCLILMIAFGDLAKAQGSPSSVFYGLATLDNGTPIPVGSIVEAYDTASYLCGTFTVRTEGKYGFMTVTGDDGYGQVGPDPGELITFYINGILATPNGPDDPIFTGNWDPQIHVDLTIPATTGVSMAVVSLPDDQTAIPGVTIRYYITVQNTGDGTDFYSVSALSDHGWIINSQANPVYAAAGEEATVWFEVDIPVNIQYDIDDIVDFAVTSGADPNEEITASVTTHVMIPTDVMDDDHGLLPGDFELYQNYPNPFNPTTTISFNLANRASVELQIYNFLGQEIDVVHLENLSSGFHNVEYDAGNLASGVYLYRLRVGEQSQVRKMVLLK